MEYNIEEETDQRLGIQVPFVKGDTRPRQTMIENIRILGMERGDSSQTFVPIRGTELLVPRLEAYVAFGGDLPYDVTLICGFDGVVSELKEVRYQKRPDSDKEVSPTLIRKVPLASLFRRAIAENRTGYRKRPEGHVWHIGEEEKPTLYLEPLQRLAGESRRRVPDEEMRQVADIYQKAVADGRRDPKKAVAEELRLNPNTARKRIQRARTLGYLGPAPGPRRGGIV